METITKTAINLTFDHVARALDFSNVGSYIEEEVARFVREQGLTDEPHIFMATHSWGGRDWSIVEGRNPVFFREDSNGGWHIFREGDVTELFCSSARSGSSLSAVLMPDGAWRVTLEVPVVEGKPYMGAYWESFHVTFAGFPIVDDDWEDEEGQKLHDAAYAASRRAGIDLDKV